MKKVSIYFNHIHDNSCFTFIIGETFYSLVKKNIKLMNVIVDMEGGETYNFFPNKNKEVSIEFARDFWVKMAKRGWEQVEAYNKDKTND